MTDVNAWDIKLVHRESFEWVETLRGLGVPRVVSHGFAKVVEGLYERLSSEAQGLTLKALYKLITAGVFAGVQPFFTLSGLLHVQLNPEMTRKEVAESVGRGVGLLLSEAPKVFEQVSCALVENEEAMTLIEAVVGQLQDLVVQQQQILQRHYPLTGDGSLSTELLGTRLVGEDLEGGILPKIYEGLNELLTAVRVSGNWLPAWDSLVYMPMDLRQTRELFAAVGDLLGVLDDEKNAELKRLYGYRWAGLDERLLTHLSVKFSWMPKGR